MGMRSGAADMTDWNHLFDREEPGVGPPRHETFIVRDHTRLSGASSEAAIADLDVPLQGGDGVGIPAPARLFVGQACARSLLWLQTRQPLPAAIYMATGLLLTIGFEYYYTEVSLRWTYSDLMPRVAPPATGLDPLIQWLLILLLVLLAIAALIKYLRS